MSKPLELWKLHQLAREYGQRPSGILGVADEWAAYELDLACLMVSRRAERAVADGKSVDEALRVKGEVAGMTEKATTRVATTFADPRGLVTLRMRIPESGVW